MSLLAKEDTEIGLPRNPYHNSLYLHL